MKSIIAATAILLLAVPPDPAVLFKSGDFVAADAAAKSTLAQTPTDPGALLVAGSIALYRNDLATASDDLARIPAGGPDAQRIGRLDAEILRRQQIAKHSDITFGPARDVTKFVETVPLPVVPVTVNGHPALFAIDTGAPGIALDRDFAKSLSLPAAPSKNVMFADGKPVEISEGLVATLGVGGATVRDLTADELPLHEFMNPGTHTVDGVIGMAVLQRFSAFSLDYAHGELTTYAPGATVTGDAETTVLLYFVGDHFLAIPSTIAGIEGISLVDTGLVGGGIVPSADVVERAHLALTDSGPGTLPSGAHMQGSTLTVPEVRVGTAVEHDIPGVFSRGPTLADRLGFAVNGVMSHGFFEHRAVTFDFTHMQVRISAHVP